MSITVLPKEISELIAAGEVIERPSSVIKELVENAIDAGAARVTVEIKHGGATYMRITDDGCGIAPDEVATAFLRHATSKIGERADLDAIETLGFRGEALASVAAVAHVEVLTKRREDALGTAYRISGSVEEGCEPTGCPDGTTFVIRDLFYNVPVRQKFLRKDVTEGNAVAAILQKIALSHPEVAFTLIRDNKTDFHASGDGTLLSAIYAVYGRNFAQDLLPVSYEADGIRVTGFAGKPLYARKNRAFQAFFINGRSVRSLTCSVALEEAYRTLMMTGKFPTCVLMLEVPPSTVDVNIHPAKAEVRFSDDKRVASAVFFAVKTALMQNGLIYEFQMKPTADWQKPQAPAGMTFADVPLPVEEPPAPKPEAQQATPEPVAVSTAPEPLAGATAPTAQPMLSSPKRAYEEPRRAPRRDLICEPEPVPTAPEPSKPAPPVESPAPDLSAFRI